MSRLINRILAPTDFTVHANAAIETAADFARTFNATLVLFHVIDTPAYNNIFFKGEIQTPDQMARDFAMDQLRELQQQSLFQGIDVQINVGNGRIYSTIIEEAEKQNADLIVMGAHGLTGLERLILGTNARRVIHLTSVPVLTVKQPLKVINVKKVAFASSFNQEYTFSFPSMYQYIEAFSAQINFVKVVTPKDFETSAYSKKTMDDFASSLNLKEYVPHIVNAKSVEEGLSWFCYEHQIDLLFMPTHGHQGVVRMWSGSHTQKMGQEYSVPVFSLKMVKIKKSKGVIFPD